MSSYPTGLALIWSKREPIAVGVVKSSGVPLTDLSSPVGINVASEGVYCVGRHRQLVIQDRAGVGAGQVEVAMVRQVDRRRLVGRGGVVDLDRVVGRHGVRHADGEVARESFLAIPAEVRQLDGRAVGPETSSAFQTTLSKPFSPPCRRVGAVVEGQLVLVAVEREPALGDPVGDPAGDGPEMRVLGQVGVQRVEAEDHVGRLPRAGPARGVP